MKQLPMAFLISGTLLFTSCAPQLGGDDYNAGAVGEISKTLRGKIVAVRVIEIQAKDRSDVGTGGVIGAITGAVLGSTLGQGSGSAVTTVAGGLAGGAAGHLIEGKLSKQQGFEYQIQLEHGDLITLTQGAEPQLAVGDKVLVIEGSGRSRVTRDNT